MDPTRRRSDRLRDVFQKCNHVVIGPFLDLDDFRNGEPRSLSDFRRVDFGNLTEFGHPFAGKHLNLQPDLELALVRPNLTHLWPGITINHTGKIKAGRKSEKRFVKKENR